MTGDVSAPERIVTNGASRVVDIRTPLGPVADGEYEYVRADVHARVVAERDEAHA